MSRVLSACVALAALACAADALKLPSYIKACRADDPELNKCAVTYGREAIPGLLNGDRKYRIPNLNPLTMYNFNVDQGGSSSLGLKIAMKEAQIFGLDTADLKNARIDLKKRAMEFDIEVDKATIAGKYDVSGRVLILPIVGNGDANITFTKLELTYKLTYDLEKKKNGKEYIELKDHKLDFKVGRAYFTLTNLFNGDRNLGDNMNTFLNENWRDVVKELGPPLADAIAQVVHQILMQIVELVPYDRVFV